MRELSRPDLDAQARTMIESYWRTLKANRISAVYLPSDPEGGGAPLSIAVKQHVAPPGRPFADSLRALASGASVETLDTSIGTVLRWVKDAHGTGEFDGVASRQIGYGFPLPGADEHRGMVFLASIAHVDDADSSYLDLLTETADTIMETFRWR
ncbi:hypothetical protein LJR045_000422 [Microbacterium sp. LjRoot45]|uniref:hypothetical protein n=1 Tax=Microbacterium sp. LjRoot45 TaxID=3342329 RepID=UPI003ED11EBD